MQPRRINCSKFTLCSLMSLAIGGGLIFRGSGMADESAVDRAAVERSVRRAVEYLSREVASWKAEHKCYSCHNHGDAARALFAAKRLNIEAAPAAINVAADWLRTPDQWDHNGPDGPFSDRKLARIQFAAALTEAAENQFITDRRPLLQAAEQLSNEQQPTGAWDFEGADSIGGPTTYGRALATVQARRVLLVADRQRFQNAIVRSDDWLRKTEPKSVINAAAVLWGLSDARDEATTSQRWRCRDILQRGQTDDGGWGPYVTSNPEPFDTALAILALSAEPDEPAREARSRGIAYLVRIQLSDGSWPETTRPLPRESYSQRISTTAWATLALLSR